jgi:hypothetical protein
LRYSSTILNSALDKGEWSATRPGLFTPGETALGSHYIAGWVDPKSGLDAMEISIESKLLRPFIVDAFCGNEWTAVII